MKNTSNAMLTANQELSDDQRREALAQGRADANTLLTQMRDAGSPVQFGFAIKAMIEKGTYDPHAIGFCQAIAEALL